MTLQISNRRALVLIGKSCLPSAPGWVLQDFACASELSGGGRKRPPPSSDPPRTIREVVAKQPCRECRARRAGFICSFKRLRGFRQLDDGTFDPKAAYFRTEPDTVPDFPTRSDFNAPFTEKEASMLKTIAAHKLGPTIEQELAHASQPGACRVARDLGIVITCDACLHVILCGGWICQLCGHELCFDCHAIVRLFEANARGESSPELDGLPKASLARIMTCWGRNKHGTTDFVPLTRIDADRLLQTVVDMKTWRECHPLELGNILSPKWADQYLHQPPEEDNSHPYLKLPSNVLPSTTTNETLQDIERSREDEDAPVNIFRALWSRGEAMVVDLDLSEVSRVLWTPQYFIDQFGQAPVTIASNILGRPDRLSTVGEFFSTFGQSTGLVNSEKIKASPGILHFCRASNEG